MFDGFDVKQLETLAKDLKTASDDVRKNFDAMQLEQKNLGKATQETTTKVDAALVEFNKLGLRTAELEQKMVAFLTPEGRLASRGAGIKTIGEMFVESEYYTSFLKDRRSKGSVRVEFDEKALNVPLSQKAILSTAWPIIADRTPGIIPLQFAPLTVRALMAPGRTTSNAVEFVRETAFTNAAAIVPEGTAKPESTKTFTLISNPVVLIAHWIKTSVQALQDLPQLRSIIDSNLLIGLRIVEEGELLNGPGGAGRLNGLYTQATALTPAAPASTTAIDVVRMMILQIQLAGFIPDGIVMAPQAWAAIELQKDTTGQYLIGNPTGTIIPRLWGLPVVVSQTNPPFTTTAGANSCLVGAFGTQSQIFDRMDAAIFVSTEDQDNFIKNMVTILAEERLTSVVYNPTAFVKVADLTP